MEVTVYVCYGKLCKDGSNSVCVASKHYKVGSNLLINVELAFSNFFELTILFEHDHIQIYTYDKVSGTRTLKWTNLSESMSNMECYTSNMKQIKWGIHV